MSTNTSYACFKSMDITFAVIYAIIAVSLLLANLFACAVFLSHRRLRETYMNIFLVSLALSDISVAVLIVPGYATFCTGCSEEFKKLASSQACRILDGVKDYVLLNSMFNVLSITYDRYVAVMRPLYYGQEITTTRVICLLTSVWVAPIPLAIVKPLFKGIDINLLSQTGERVFDIAIVSCFIIVPISMLIVVNAMLANAIRKQMSRNVPTRRQETSSTRERDQRKTWERSGTRSCLIVVAICVICWLPRVMLNFFYLFGSAQVNMNLLGKISLIFLLLQSLFNPLVYSFYRRDFRQGAHNLLRKINGWCPSLRTKVQPLPAAVPGKGDESTVWEL